MHKHVSRLRERWRIAARKGGLAGGLVNGLAGKRAAARAMAALALAATVGTAARADYLFLAASKTMVVTSDRGGYLTQRSDQISRLRAAGDRVELRGTCLSACTMYLSLPNVCVAPTAIFGFHGPSLNGVPLPPRDFDYWSEVMASNYNPPLRSWFMKKARYNTSGYYQVTGEQLIRLGYPTC